MLSDRRRAQLGLAAAFIVLSASVSALLLVPRSSRAIAVADIGTAAPDFLLRDVVDGRAVSLSDYRGHAVVLYFGSLRCPKTSAYNQRVSQLGRRYSGDSRVKFLAIDVGGGGSPHGALEDWQRQADVKDLHRPFATLLDEQGTVAARYSVRELPMIVLIDPLGRVAYRGPFDDHADVAFATRHFCHDALRETLQVPTIGFVKSDAPHSSF